MSCKETRRLRIGLVGCGPIAQAAHLDATRKARNADLYAICDVARDLTQRVAAIYQPDIIYHDFDPHAGRPEGGCGSGCLDYARYISLLRSVQVPLVIHGLSEQEVPRALQFLRAVL